MYGYIYKTTDLLNNKIYVGQHKALKFDEKYYGSGIIIKELLNKYGTQRFSCEVLEWCSSQDELNQKEIFWINELNCLDETIGYNIATGGAFGDSGYHLGMLGKSQSTKQKLAVKNYQLTHPKTSGMKSKMQKTMRGNTNASHGKGMKFVHKGYDVQTRIKEELIPEYLENGWSLGKCQQAIDNQQKSHKQKYNNSTFVHKGLIAKLVDNSEVNQYLNSGWELGKKGTLNYIRHK